MPKKSNRVVLLISLFLISGFLATSLASYFVSRASLRKEIEQSSLPLTGDNIYSEIQRDLFRPIFISSLMATDTFLRDWVLAGEGDPVQITRYLKEIQTKYGTFSSFLVSEKTRNYYYPNGILKQVRPDAERDNWYFRVRSMEPGYEINVDPDMANQDNMTIFINYKVYGYQGEFIGATGVGLTVNAVKSLIESYRSRYHRDIYFADTKGNITLSSTSFAGKGSRLQDLPGLAPLAQSVLDSDSLTLKYERDGEVVHLNTRYIKEFGWFLLVEQTERQALRPIFNALLLNLGICALVTCLVLLITHRTLNVYQRRLEDSAATDKLTGAYNRKAIEGFFEQAQAENRRTGVVLSMFLFDLDHFKQVNDRFGHQAGDSVLQEISHRVRVTIREADLFFRWGGEEFLVLLKGCPLPSALKIAEKVRCAISDQALFHDKEKITTTASFGVAECQPGEDLDQLIKRVDQALYLAKDRGRNRSEVSDVSPADPVPEVKD